jgi:hypothetical protein
MGICKERNSKLTEDEQLNQLLENSQPLQHRPTDEQIKGQQSAPTSSAQSSIEFRQWQIGANDTFRPAGLTRETLPGGVYTFEQDEYGNLFIRMIKVITDSLIILPDNASERVLAGMQTFWEMEHRYRKHGLLYRRGVLLWGPPGSGKTATLMLLSKHLIESGGLVVVCTIPLLTSRGLAALRRIEPNRRIICIMEDIDEMIQNNGEHQLLALLDGENQVENIVNIATTNYPDRLGARIVNRPSRFDERILVGMPSADARRIYLRKVTGEMSDQELGKWVGDTDQLSIAHLRELAAAVLCLGQDYQKVIARLRSMRYRPKEKDGIADQPIGFVS